MSVMALASVSRGSLLPNATAIELSCTCNSKLTLQPYCQIRRPAKFRSFTSSHSAMPKSTARRLALTDL